MKIDPTFVDIIDIEMKSGNTVFLSGEPGIGKTSLVKSLAARDRTKCFVVSINVLADKADLTGARVVPTPDGKSFEQRFVAHHKVREAVAWANTHPRDVVYLVLDEINRTSPDVTSGALSITTERELGDQTLPENLKIVVTGNVKGNVVALDDASLSRFVVYSVEPDAPTLIAYLDARNGGHRPMHPACKAVLTTNPELVFEKSAPTSYTVVDQGDDDDDDMRTSFDQLMDAGEEMLQLTTPRTIEGLSNWLDEAPRDMLRSLFQTQVQIGDRTVSMLQEVVEGHVGNTRFAKMVVGEIAKGLASPQASSQAPGIVIPKPGCWQQLKAATTQSELDDVVTQLTDDEKSGSLVYAICDKTDNRAIIEHLLAGGASTLSQDNQVLVQALQADRYDQANLETVLSYPEPNADSIRQISGLLGLA